MYTLDQIDLKCAVCIPLWSSCVTLCIDLSFLSCIQSVAETSAFFNSRILGLVRGLKFKDQEGEEERRAGKGQREIEY